MRFHSKMHSCKAEEAVLGGQRSIVAIVSTIPNVQYLMLSSDIESIKLSNTKSISSSMRGIRYESQIIIANNFRCLT